MHASQSRSRCAVLIWLLCVELHTGWPTRYEKCGSACEHVVPTSNLPVHDGLEYMGRERGVAAPKSTSFAPDGAHRRTSEIEPCTGCDVAPVLLQLVKRSRPSLSSQVLEREGAPTNTPDSTLDEKTCHPVYIRLFHLMITLVVLSAMAIPCILAAGYWYRKEPPKKLLKWQEEYQPWMVMIHAFLHIGQQIVILLFVYYQICEWNPESLDVMRNCHVRLGWRAIPCEATKAFARCFPLLGASIGIIVTGRYALQRRIWYELLERRNILVDFTNYDPWQDPVWFLLIFCFSCGMLHFYPYLFEPPYSRLASVCSRWVVPCAVFFALLKQSINTEQELVPVSKFIEEDPLVAKDRLELTTCLKEAYLMRASHHMHRKVSGPKTLDELIEEMLSETSSVNVERINSALHKGTENRNLLLKGIWPANLLLYFHLIDDTSKDPSTLPYIENSLEFWYAWTSYGFAFLLVNSCVLVALSASLCREIFKKAFSNCSGMLFTIKVLGRSYRRIGKGYCRGYGMNHLYGYFRPLVEGGQELSEPGGRHCAGYCSGAPSCVAFTVDWDSCNIYLDSIEPAPEGWFAFNAQGPYESVVVQANNDHEVTCWSKDDGVSMPEMWAGIIVNALHMVLVLCPFLYFTHSQLKGRVTRQAMK